MLAVAIVFVGDEIVWRGIPSCGYDWPIGQNYHAVIYAFLFGIVYCISYFLFTYWALDLLKQKTFGPRQSVVLRESERRRDKVALLFLLINFCCWTPFWGYHIYVMIHYYQVRPTIHIPGGYHTDEMLVSAVVYLSASINIIPCALFIKDWAPQFWLKTLIIQSNVTVLQVKPSLNLNINGSGSLPSNPHGTVPDRGSHHGDNYELGDGIELSYLTHWTHSREKGIGNGVEEGRLQVLTSPPLNTTLGIPSTSY